MLAVKQVLTVIVDLSRRKVDSHSKTSQVRHLRSGIPLFLQTALGREHIYRAGLHAGSETEHGGYLRAEYWTAGLTSDDGVQGVTAQANSSLKHILEQHGISGTPTLLQQLVSTCPSSCLLSAIGLTNAIIKVLFRLKGSHLPVGQSWVVDEGGFYKAEHDARGGGSEVCTAAAESERSPDI